MSRVLYTIGYEGMDIDSFIEKIKDYALLHNIGAVCDVRESPRSRKKGFSEKGLEFALKTRGIQYYNESHFGNPYRKDIRGGEMLRLYNEYIREDMSRKTLISLADAIADKEYSCCLICYERDYRKCHRSVLADYLAELNPALTIVHL